MTSSACVGNKEGFESRKLNELLHYIINWVWYLLRPLVVLEWRLFVIEWCTIWQTRSSSRQKSGILLQTVNVYNESIVARKSLTYKTVKIEVEITTTVDAV